MNRFLLLILIVCTLIVSSCASVPKESVELSATVGRDIAVVHKSHRELAQILFSRMKRDINRFVDNVYAPHQVRAVMNRQYDLARSSDPNDKRKSLILAINEAVKPNASEKLQAAVLKGMEGLVGKIREDVESMRTELLDPMISQEAEVIGSIDRAYQQLHYANSIVTGHLSSVVKVHDAQSDLLNEIGIKRDLRKEVSETLANTSENISNFVDLAEKSGSTLDKVEDKANALKKTIGGLKTKLNKVSGNAEE